MDDELRAVIWDMDGVLVLSGDVHYDAWQQVLARYGLAMSREQFDQTFGMNNHNILRRLYGEQLDPEQMDEVAQSKEAAYRELIRGRVQPLPGVRDWLARLRAADWRQAVASSGPMANIAAILNELDTWDVFDAVLSGARLARSKPDPAIFLQAAAAVGAEPARCIVVEDAGVGIEAARRAGMRAIAVTTTLPADELQAADHIVDRLDHLPPDAFDRLVP
jgi:beta-phosphoglucomutase family hydrolase